MGKPQGQGPTGGEGLRPAPNNGEVNYVNLLSISFWNENEKKKLSVMSLSGLLNAHIP